MNHSEKLTRFAIMLLLVSGCRINPSFHKLPEKEQAGLRPATASVAEIGLGQGAAAPSAMPPVADSLKLYTMDSRLVKDYIDQSPREFTHLYIYGSFCKPCVMELPGLVHDAAQHQQANLLLVSVENYVSSTVIKRFLAKGGVGFPTYILDADKYGDAYSPDKRYRKFVDELYPGHPELEGVPTHLVLDKQHRVRYAAFGGGRFSNAVLDSLAQVER